VSLRQGFLASVDACTSELYRVSRGETALSASMNMSVGSHRITVYAVNTSGTIWEQAVWIHVP
jgi:hypothetical protein